MTARSKFLFSEKIQPGELVLHLTLRCPLRCAHCCVEADSTKEGSLELARVLAAIDGAASNRKVFRISFAGGEPFLHPDLLLRGVSQSRRHGLESCIVTSAYWASTPERAHKTIQPLADAGLTQINVSYDDPHAKYVPERKIVNAYRAASQAGVRTLITLAVEADSRINRTYMLRLLGNSAQADPLLTITESAINSTGRAAEDVDGLRRDQRRQHELVYRGPCRSALRQFSVHHDGKVTGCCGVIPFREGLQVGDLNRQSMPEIMERAYRNDVLKWLAFEGPVAIMKQISAHGERPFEDEDFDGICHACDVLFSSREHTDLLERALPDKRQSLMVQEMVYRAMDMGLGSDDPEQPPAETEVIRELMREVP